MRVRRGVLAVLGTVALVAVAAPAVADPVTNFEMPFPCGEQWTGTTRASHSPSSRAIDWNRADDVNDPVVASAPGVVTVADKVNDSGYGRWVTIDHGNNERTIYAHLSSVMVSVGQRVDQGQQVGTLGTTGNSTGPHLHFEERSGSTVLWPFLHRAKFVFGSTPASKNCVEVPMAVDWNGDKDRRADASSDATTRPCSASCAPARPRCSADLRRLDRRPGPRRLGRQRHRERGRPQPHDQDVLDEAPLRHRHRLLFGLATDKPIAGDWDGDKMWTPGLWRASDRQFILRAADGSVQRITLGDTNDLPVTGDWDGDGRTDVGVYDQATATFTLRKTDDDGTVWIANVQFGKAGDLPAVGDWDGNKKTDLGVWSPTSGTFTQRKATSPSAAMRGTTTIRFGKRR